MPDEIQHSDGRIENPSVRYDRTDANFGRILSILIGAAIFAVILFSGMRIFFNEYRDHQAEIKKSPYPLAPGPSTALPREPRLEQVDRLAEIETPNVYDRLESKEHKLNNYGSTSEQDFLHIPIDRAMELLANKLPVRPEPPGDKSKHADGLIDAGESNSGRLFQRRPK